MRFCKQAITIALTLAALSMHGGCTGTAIDHGDDGEPAPPGWLTGLPERSVKAAPGDTVWAVVPKLGSEAAEIRTYRLESATGSEAVLVDAIGNRHQGVPGSLVYPASGFPEAELAIGTVVLADRWDASKVVGRVARLEQGQVELDYDWNGVTVTGAMDAVLALPMAEHGLALRWVGYRAPGAKDSGTEDSGTEDSGTEDSGAEDSGDPAVAVWYKGLCFAESSDRVWISTDGGHVEVVDRQAVKPLADLGRAELAPGDTIAAYSWGHGYRPGVVEEVLEPGLRYAIKLEGGETRPMFFDNLTAEPL